jgi:zinc protease
MLQLAYLKMTQPRKDEVIYDGFIARQREVAQNSLSRPEVKFIDTMVATLYNNNPRMQGVPRPQDFDHVALNRAFDIYRDRFASAKDFTFFVVGSFDVEKIKPLLATYLASLPVGELPVAFQDRGLRPIKGVVKKDLRMGAEAKSAISITMTGEAEYSAAEQMRLQALAEVFNIKLIEVLREKMGMIYGGNMNASLSRLPYGSYAVSINLPCGPENVDKVIAATLAEIEKIKDNGVQEADLNKVKINWTKNYRKGLRENGFWMNQMKGAFINGTDPDEVLNYEARVEALTSAQLQDAAKRYLNLDNYVQIVLYPEKMPEKAAEKAPVTSVSVSNAALN